ncbi:MAG: 4Fe-4S binding protein [Hydrogenophilales bacterium]|nr:4Fe-4S binding protein [Hydrogenophilales bacterium]
MKGAFRTFKTTVLWIGFAVYFLLPWLPWSRNDAPAQAVLFDIPGRRYMMFDFVVYPQDIFWLSMLLFIAAVVLFFATSLVGRAFCGYFCFQTLWTDAYIWIEHFLQGERPARLKLAREATYLAAGVLREHVCTFICPYGRFQSAMYDPETLTAHYDRKRGEGASGRMAARAGLRTLDERHAKGHGDCIDCSLCVQVCPVGIDIRDGLQPTCISCGLCVDACNAIMDKMAYPRGLVRYDSETNLNKPMPAKPFLDWKRLKVIGYGVSIVLMTAYLFYDIQHRHSFEHSIQQIRSPLYVVLSDGNIRNRYQIRLTNISGAPETYSIEARGIPAGALDVGNFQQVAVRNGKSVIIQASVELTPQSADSIGEFEFVIRNGKGEVVVDPVRFFTRKNG